MGRAWNPGDERLADVRVWRIQGFSNHLVFYRPIQGGIEVFRVVHGARDLPNVLKEEWD